MGIFRVGIVRVGVILGGNCQDGSYPEWVFSLVGVFRVGIVRGNHLGGSFPRTCHSSFGSQLLNVFCNLVNKHVVEHTQVSITYVVTTKQGKNKKRMTQPMSF